MADRFKFTLPDGRRVTTSSPAAAIRLKYGHGAKEVPRTKKVAKAVDEAKAAADQSDQSDEKPEKKTESEKPAKK